MTIATLISVIVLVATITLAIVRSKAQASRRSAAAHDDEGPVVRRPVFLEHELGVR